MATKTLARRHFSIILHKRALTTAAVRLFFDPLLLPGSSVAEQVTVNHLVEGSIPSRAAIYNEWLTQRQKTPEYFVCPSSVPLFESCPSLSV